MPSNADTPSEFKAPTLQEKSWALNSFPTFYKNIYTICILILHISEENQQLTKCSTANGITELTISSDLSRSDTIKSQKWLKISTLNTYNLEL